MNQMQKHNEGKLKPPEPEPDVYFGQTLRPQTVENELKIKKDPSTEEATPKNQGFVNQAHWNVDKNGVR